MMLFKSTKCKRCKKRDFKDNMSHYIRHFTYDTEIYWAHEKCEDKYDGVVKCPECKGQGKINKESK